MIVVLFQLAVRATALLPERSRLRFAIMDGAARVARRFA